MGFWRLFGLIFWPFRLHAKNLPSWRQRELLWRFSIWAWQYKRTRSAVLVLSRCSVASSDSKNYVDPTSK